MRRANGYEEVGRRRSPYQVDYEGQNSRQGRLNIFYSGETTSPQKMEYEENAGKLSLLYGSEIKDSALAGRNNGKRPEGSYLARSRESMPGRRCETGCESVPVRRREAGRESVSVRRRETGREVVPVRGRREAEVNSLMYDGRIGRNVGYETISRNRGYAGRASARPSQSRSVKDTRRSTYSRRRKRAMMQRLMVGIWIMCIVVLGAAFVIRNRQVAVAGSSQENGSSSGNLAESSLALSGKTVQGIPAEVYARHPRWEEDFLTPNEYSRPGDALESVTNIFVHYTANPGTSAAQNRSYFEQQKDVHEVSVSSHFIIGYEGEILQCVPLDEIAYAVMTRNYDSISIECCYLAEDGSFTAETYDSLVSLLAWLTDAYGLDSEDILRHYDCGGKKCPLYYTENEDEWEQLKKDVDKL